MIDLHFHLVPGVDDGPETVAEAAAMARAALADGCEVVVATPHQRHSRWANLDLEDLERRLDAVRAAVGPRPQLIAGAEIRLGVGLLDDLEHGRLLGLGGAGAILLECARNEPDDELEDLVHELVLLGRPPLLAHVERIPWLVDDPRRVAALVELGATVQVTAGSVLGALGRVPEAASWRLLDAGLVDVLASDAHGLEWRPPGLSAARRRIARRYGEEVGALLTEVNPAAILAGRPLGR